MFVVVVIALFVFSGATRFEGCAPFAPLPPGWVGTDTCMGCHDGRSASDMRRFHDGPHRHLACETCHGPGYLHVRSGGHEPNSIDNPARLPFSRSAGLCAQCHSDAVDGHSKTAHAQLRAASCHACHDTHRRGGMRFELTAAGRPDVESLALFCGQCHSPQAHEFLESGHARVGVATCASCHDMHGAGMFTASPKDNALCLQCHGSAFLGFNTEERIDRHTGAFHPVDPAGSGASRCTACHMPPATQEGQPSVDHNHTMWTIPPAHSNEWLAAGLVPPPNSCSGILGCHDPETPGSGTPFDVNSWQDNEVLQEWYEHIEAVR